MKRDVVRCGEWELERRLAFCFFFFFKRARNLIWIFVKDRMMGLGGGGLGEALGGLSTLDVSHCFGETHPFLSETLPFLSETLCFWSGVCLLNDLF